MKKRRKNKDMLEVIIRLLVRAILTITVVFAIIYLIGEPEEITIHIIMGKLGCIFYLYFLASSYNEYEERK